MLSEWLAALSFRQPHLRGSDVNSVQTDLGVLKNAPFSFLLAGCKDLLRRGELWVQKAPSLVNVVNVKVVNAAPNQVDLTL
jgi:hypothetical protein